MPGPSDEEHVSLFTGGKSATDRTTVCRYPNILVVLIPHLHTLRRTGKLPELGTVAMCSHNWGVKTLQLFLLKVHPRLACIVTACVAHNEQKHTERHYKCRLVRRHDTGRTRWHVLTLSNFVLAVTPNWQRFFSSQRLRACLRKCLFELLSGQRAESVLESVVARFGVRCRDCDVCCSSAVCTTGAYITQIYMRYSKPASQRYFATCTVWLCMYK